MHLGEGSVGKIAEEKKKKKEEKKVPVTMIATLCYGAFSKLIQR